MPPRISTITFFSSLGSLGIRSIFKSSSSALPKTGTKKKLVFKNEGLAVPFESDDVMQCICGTDVYFAENTNRLFDGVELFKEEWNVFGEN